MNEVTHQRIKTNGIWMHIAEQGTGPLVLLLHGFPEIWYSWRHQIGYLAKHGYHVVAPDMRGYGDTDSPLSPTSYSIQHLVGDLVGILDHFGEQKVFFLSFLFSSSVFYFVVTVLIVCLSYLKGICSGTWLWSRCSLASEPVQAWQSQGPDCTICSILWKIFKHQGFWICEANFRWRVLRLSVSGSFLVKTWTCSSS